MGIFTGMELNSLDDLFLLEIEDLYDAEKRLTKALPQMAEAAHDQQLKIAFQSHLKETEKQVERLETIFNKLGKKPRRETCDAMKGLISEGEDILKADGDAAVKDAAMIGAAQRVEHYEIAAYGTARTLAQRLNQSEVARLLQETLDEERAADKKLTGIAEGSVNVQAATR
ncbi:MAG: ferritin-like domain-containing protein [Pirellulales bacterium]